jgi:hypothetical protein
MDNQQQKKPHGYGSRFFELPTFAVSLALWLSGAALMSLCFLAVYLLVWLALFMF